ncbi:hypothetical protein FRC91_18485 [Bradymonadales bacterium TMQ1]|nr:hypothetical protein FRC91_18485 [Bradymonadales bacterium TMQ1]
MVAIRECLIRAIAHGAGIGVWVVGLCLSVEAGAQEARWEAAVRAGSEYDSNPSREEGAGSAGDGLTRYYGELELESDVGERGQVRGQVQHGGKVFWGAREADAFLSAAQVAGARWFESGLAVSASGDVKDRSERVSVRDYVRAGASGQVMWSGGPLRMWGGGGWRYFGFKPQPEVSSQGPMVQAGAAFRLRSDMWARAAWSRSWRGFEGEPLRLRGNQTLDWEEGARRADVFDVVQAGVSYRRWLVAELGYAYQRNQSNSYGQGLRRHQVEASLTLPGPWEIFVSGRVEVQRTRYEDPVLIDETFVIDDENRNAFVVAVARQVAENWEVELRYDLYAQEFGVGEAYGRQVLGLSVAYRAGGQD